MTVHSFHLATVPSRVGAAALLRPDQPVAGRSHAEHLALMRLGAPALSPDRAQVRRLAVFSQWEGHAALDDYLAGDPLGTQLARGWYLRMEFVHRWGAVQGVHRLPVNASAMAPDEPVVALTLARLRIPELPRFFRWGRPVERQVRDDPAALLALAATRPPRTFSTFTVWRTFADMRAMVEGHSTDVGAGRHAGAMVERERRDFHSEFTTLRFRPLSEHGTWDGRTDIIPT